MRGDGRGRDLILVARHRLLRECLASALKEASRWRVRAEVESLGEVLQDPGGLPADVVIADLTLPQDGLPEHLRQVRGRWPEIKVLLLGPREVEEDFLPLLEAGASGYLIHDCSITELETTLDRVLEDEPQVSPRVAYALFTRLGELGRERLRRQRVEVLVLTPREIEVLHLVSRGCSNRQIAERLHLSVCTVKNHVHNILDKLEVEHRRQAVEVAVRRRWLPDRRRREPPPAPFAGLGPRPS